VRPRVGYFLLVATTSTSLESISRQRTTTVSSINRISPYIYTHTHMECTVEYNGLRHRRVRRWWKSPIRDEQVLLHLSHGQTVPVVLMTCCLRAACRQPSVITITKNGYYSEECLCRRPHSLFPQRSVLSCPAQHTATCRLTRVGAAVWPELRPYRYIRTALVADCR